MLDRKCALC